MEINEIGNRKNRIKKTKSWFFGKINKIDKSLAKLIKKKEKMQNTKIKNESGDILQTLEKWNGLYKNTINNCMPTN